MRPPREAPPRESLLALFPRGTLAKILSLLLLLAGVIYFKRRSDAVARALAGVAPPIPAAAADRGPPRVRLQIDPERLPASPALLPGRK